MRESHPNSTSPNTEEPLIFADMSAKIYGSSVLGLVEFKAGFKLCHFYKLISISMFCYGNYLISAKLNGSSIFGLVELKAGFCVIFTS